MIGAGAPTWLVRYIVPIIWDMGAIAECGSISLFQTVLLAAISVPVAFNPVEISPLNMPKGFFETHVDASLFAHIYATDKIFPRACKTGQQRCNLHIIIHNKTIAEPKIVKWSAPSIAKRSLDTVVKANLNARLQSTWQMARANGISFHLAYLDVPFPSVSPIAFDIEYMQRLYELGVGKAKTLATWQGNPPPER